VALAKKKAWIWIAASVVALLALGGLVLLLFLALTKSSEAAKGLEDARIRLENYYARNPFPNHTNVLVEKSNAATMKQWREDLLSTVSANQIEAPSKTPAQFEIFLTARSKDLRDAAKRNGVTLPANFSFGFSRYAEGHALPESRDDLPTRLAEQLVLVDHICRMLFEERISELSLVTREEFAVEKTDGFGTGPGPGGAPRPGPGGPSGRPRLAATPAAAAPSASDRLTASSGYRKLHVTFERRAREAALTGLLNRLASDSMFIVVNSVEIATTADPQLGMQPRREDATNTVERAAKVVCGPEITDPAQVKIELDVYRF
jgi:hypothetical protein